MSSDLLERSAVELRRLIGSREISPVQLLQACIERIEAVNPFINAVTATCFERALAEAREAEALDADEVQVELRPRGEDGAMAMGTMRASGEVRLEARQWTDARRQGEPRVFRMNAPNVSYDGTSGSAAVDGAGALLVFDPAIGRASCRERV